MIALVRIIRYLRRRKQAGFGFAFALLALAVIGNAVAFWWFDGPLYRDDGGLGPGDALWYSIVSVTTIGYGDYYAQSTGARIAAVLFVVVVGLGAFTVLLGMIIDWATDLALQEQRGMSTVTTRDHILIVNFPSANRVHQLVGELQADAEHRRRDIVIVSDAIDALPFRGDRLQFVKGSVLGAATYERANLADACMVIVLADSYSDPNSDAVVASAAAVIGRMRPGIHLVAECLEPSHRPLFASVNVDAVVNSLSITGNLLAQEAQDPGVSQMMDVFTSNTRGATLFSTVVPSSVARSYRELAIALLERDVNLVCVNRGSDSLTAFGSLSVEAGDRVIYASDRRLNWSEIG